MSSLPALPYRMYETEIEIRKTHVKKSLVDGWLESIAIGCQPTKQITRNEKLNNKTIVCETLK